MDALGEADVCTFVVAAIVEGSIASAAAWVSLELGLRVSSMIVCASFRVISPRLAYQYLPLKWKCHCWSGGKFLVDSKRPITSSLGLRGNRSSSLSFNRFSFRTGAVPIGSGLGMVPFANGAGRVGFAAWVGFKGLKRIKLKVRCKMR